MKTHQKKHKKALFVMLFFVIIYISLYALGFSFNIKLYLASSIFFVAMAIVHYKLANILFYIYLISAIVYFPIGMQYGPPNYGIIGSLFETNQLEAIEFLTTISITVWIYQFVFAFLCILFVKYKKYIVFEKSSKSKWVLTFFIFAISFFPTIFYIIYPKDPDTTEEFIKNSQYVSLVRFYAYLTTSPFSYISQKNQLINQLKKQAAWRIQSVKPKYKNYILVIGESVRKDYMNVYGFGFPNTPFLKQENGLYIDGYMAAGSYTMISLPPTLTLSAEEAHNNMVTLANQSGFDTAWISNQGMFGFYANSTSLIAMRSNYTYFTQNGDYNTARIQSDFSLLTPFKEHINKKTKKPRLIVLHLMGSHAPFCKRIKEKPQFFYINNDLSCYVESIRETDDFLRQVLDILKAQKESYSLIYFSDHGLVHKTRDPKTATLTNSGNYKQNYEVPFIKISSDDTSHKKIKVKRSAVNFLKGFQQWTGIKTENLSTDNYDFFGKVSDESVPPYNLPDDLLLN